MLSPLHPHKSLPRVIRAILHGYHAYCRIANAKTRKRVSGVTRAAYPGKTRVRVRARLLPSGVCVCVRRAHARGAP